MTPLKETEVELEREKLKRGKPLPEQAASLLDELCGSRAEPIESPGSPSVQSVPPTGIADQQDTGPPCWVARAVYGAGNPRWMMFREWLLNDAPHWFRDLYVRHGRSFARWIAPHHGIKSVIRRWMDFVIARSR